MLMRAFLVVLASLPVWFQPVIADSWTRVGPLAGKVWSATAHPATPQIIFVSSGEPPAANRTVNGGATWTPLPVQAYQFLYNPVSPLVVYAYGGSSIYKSTDGGTSWGALSFTDATYTLAIDPSNTSRLFAGGVFPNGLYKSTNSGSTWTLVPVPATWSAVSAIAIDPANGNNIYVGTTGDWDFPGEGLFRTTNGGTSWTNISATIPGGNIASIAFDPANSAVMYIGTSGGGMYSGSGLLKSINAGAIWMQSGFSSSSVDEVITDPAHPGRIYARQGGRLHVSANDGASWSIVPTLGGVYDIQLLKDNTDVLCVGSDIGVLISTDAGAHFTAKGLTPADMSAALVDRTNSNVIHATGRGQYTSTDGGVSWQPTGVTAFGQAIVQDPVDANVFYNGAYTNQNGGVLKSVSSGSTWSSSLANKFINAVAVAASDHRVVYAGGTGGLYKSIDAGATWTTLSTAYGQVRGIAVDPYDNAVVYVGGSTGLIKSIDGGTSFSPIHTGLDQPASGWVHAVVIDPISPQTLYCGTQNEGVFKSTNGGASWSHVTGAITDVRALALDPVDPQIIYAAWYNDGIYVSADGGTAWARLGGALSGMQDVSVDALDRNVIYASGGGVWRYQRTTQAPAPVILSYDPEAIDLTLCESGCTLSLNVHTDGDHTQIASSGVERQSGNIWMPESQLSAPPGSDSWQLNRQFQSNDESGDYVFRVVTRGPDGSRSVSAPVTISVGPVSTAVPKQSFALALEQNRPNPFNPSTTVEFTMPAAGKARLAVYNVIGELVAVLLDGTAGAGNHMLMWNGRDAAGTPVSSGVYFYRLSAASQTLTRRMVLLK